MEVLNLTVSSKKRVLHPRSQPLRKLAPLVVDA